ncbi:MAG: hypothetical protein ACOVMF_00130 [Aquiluna sp.]|jgi:hypothetical protein
MQKKSAVVSPLLEPALAEGLEAITELLHKQLLSHQTVTLLFEDPAAKPAAKEMPSLLISRLPGEDWVLELPLPPITSKQDLGSKVRFFVFNDWYGPGEEIAGSFSCGPKKLLHEPDVRTLTGAVLSAVEDLLLVAEQLEVSRILIADKQGEVSDSMSRTLARFLAANDSSVGMLPANSDFFEVLSDAKGPQGKDSKDLSRQHFKLKAQLDHRKIMFFATTCYMGLPRNLFALDYSDEHLTVSTWNGQDFVICNEQHIVQAICNQGTLPQPGGPTELAPIFVSDLWPEALVKLGLQVIESEESDD